MRILITGAQGQLGSDLALLLPGAAARRRAELDIEDPAAVAAAFAESRPELVFNCAAYNAVDRAETEPDRARGVNAEGPRVLARACASASARLVHFSTNYVFDGRSAEPYREEDAPHPLGAYGRSKREGELAVLETLPDSLVVRAGALFGLRGSAIKGGSFPERIIQRARSGQPLRVVDDQTVNPTYTGDLAAAALELARSGFTGVVHLAPSGCCTWRDFALETLRLAGLDSVEVAAATSEEFAAAAARPRQGCLVSTRVAPLRSWREGLRAYWEASQTKSAAETQPM